MPAYPVRRAFATRWNDNDQYGHVNNTVYYEAMDTAVNAWMIATAGLDPQGDAIALCAASSCEFLASASFPEPLEVGIGVERLGTTSITWARRMPSAHVTLVVPRRSMPMPTSSGSGNDAAARNSHDDAAHSAIASPCGSSPAAAIIHALTAVSMAS